MSRRSESSEELALGGGRGGSSEHGPPVGHAASTGDPGAPARDERRGDAGPRDVALRDADGDLGASIVRHAPVRPRSPRMSWGLQRYMARDIVRVFFFVLALIEIGYALLVAVVAARRYDLDLFLVVPILWRTALSMLNDSVPIALLFAVGLVYGRFVADREIAAAKSFGLSYRQLLMPATSVGLAGVIFGVFVVGFLAPEMNYSKGDVSTLISAQLRYLGEGWNRHFPFGNYSVWITHYSGRELERVTLRPQSRSAVILPENASERAAETFFIYAARAQVLFPEEIREAPAPEVPDELPEEFPEHLRRSLEGNAAPDSYPAGTILFRLFDVDVFVSDEFFREGAPSSFMQRFRFSQIDVPYQPADLLPTERRPKQLTIPMLADRMAATRAASGEERIEYLELQRELYWRWARIASFFLYPALAGLIALFLNAENRYLAFFVSGITVPSVFYGLGSVGQMISGTVVPAGIAMLSGSILLAAVLVSALVLLERNWLR